jgi:hypothetical protein
MWPYVKGFCVITDVLMGVSLAFVERRIMQATDVRVSQPSLVSLVLRRGLRIWGVQPKETRKVSIVFRHCSGFYITDQMNSPSRCSYSFKAGSRIQILFLS